MADVSADVEKFVGGDRLEKPFAEAATDSWAHSRQGECDNADERASVAQVEFEWNVGLQCCRIRRVMNEDSAIPTRVKHRFAGNPKHPAPGRFAEAAAAGGDAAHVRSTPYP